MEDIPKSEGTTYGRNQPDGYPNSYSTIENDFRQGGDSIKSYQPNGSLTSYETVVLYRNPYAILKGVVYHELMHGIQRRYVTNAQLGKTWSEATTTWCENRTNYERGRLEHAVEFSVSLDSDFIQCATASCQNSRGRLLAIVERMSGLPRCS